jgi:hypothetical protein
LASLGLGLSVFGATHNHSAATSTAAKQLVSWYDGIKPDFEALTADFKTFGGTNADCVAMLADAQTLQDDPPAPDPKVNAPWQAALAGYARAGLECSSGVKNHDDAQIKAALDDVDAADGFLKRATTQLPA